jgi:16S rRNA (guanine966-N2)-methyltransferase
MSLSITGGTFNGSVLRTPSGADLTRPTSGKVRQALFNVLRGRFEDEEFLDAYAGSGSVGIEAVSRGAARAVLVEKHPAAFRELEANCRLVQARGAAKESLECVRQDARAFCLKVAALSSTEGPPEGRRFGVVFADPPFGQDFSGLPDLLLPLLKPGGVAVVQFPTRNPPEWLPRASRVLAYGESSLALFEA